MCKIKEPNEMAQSGIDDEMSGEYFQLDSDGQNQESAKNESKSRLLEKCVFVFATVGVITISQCLTWAHWLVPFIYASCTPIFVSIRTIVYWKYKWQYFMIDFCYFANILTFVCLWLPENNRLFQMVFALCNGPVLVAAVMYRNSLVLHHHDKMTSCYIHILPAVLTYCIRWYPTSTSKYWFQSFVEDEPKINMVWLFAAPFTFFFCHSVLYFLIVNIICRPEEPYVTSYSYLAEKYEKCNLIGGPMGQGIAYYGLSWLFCLSSLFLALLSYYSQSVHCTSIAFMTLAIAWNGASYYVHVFSKRGFNTTD